MKIYSEKGYFKNGQKHGKVKIKDERGQEYVE